MTGRRAAPLAALLSCLAAARPAPATAQAVAPQAQAVQLVPDAIDARAVFVNPAGLARQIEASIGGYVTVADSSRSLRAAQYGAMLQTRGLGFGWQHDRLADGRSGNAYALGLGLGDEGFALGATRTWVTGAGATGSMWVVGTHVTVRPGLSVAAAWRAVGSPTIRDSVLEEQLVPGVAWALPALRSRVSAEWHLATDGWITRVVRVAVSTAPRGVFALTMITDLSSNVRLRGFTLAVSLRRPTARAQVFRRQASLRSDMDLIGLSGQSIAPQPARRRLR